jgi:hypothetical protein
MAPSSESESASSPHGAGTYAILDSEPASKSSTQIFNTWDLLIQRIYNRLTY